MQSVNPALYRLEVLGIVETMSEDTRAQSAETGPRVRVRVRVIICGAGGTCVTTSVEYKFHLCARAYTHAKLYPKSLTQEAHT